MVIISSKRNYLDYLDSLNSRKQCSSANSTVMHFRIQVSIELKSPLSANFQFSNFQNKLKRACGKNGELVLHCFQWGKSGLKLIFLRSSGHFFEKRRFFRTTSGKNEAICKFSLGSEDYFGANKFAQNWGAEKESRLVAPLAALAADNSESL